MKVIKISDLIGTDREVKGRGFTSIRPVLAKDGMGFSVHKTIIPKGDILHWHYTQHLEACYCIQGLGLLYNKANGNKHFIEPDVIYVLDKHDDHSFKAVEDVVLISIFNPPVTGSEIHNEDGSYDLINDSMGG